MHAITLKYCPFPRIPYKKEIQTTHPENWSELTQVQFCKVVDFINNPYHELLLTNSLLSLEKPLLDFPSEIHELKSFIKLDEPFKEVLIKSFKTGGLEFFGPDDNYRNVTILEFTFADTFFIKFNRDHKEGDLDKLITTLYRPLVSGTGKRIDFDPDHLNDHLPEIGLLDGKLKNAILFNYKVNRLYIQKLYIWLFPAPSDEDNNKVPVSPWRDFIRNLINGDYVNEDKILNTLMHTVFSDTNYRIKQQKKKKK